MTSPHPHPFHEDRPDGLPISAELWDARNRFSGVDLTLAVYQAIKKLEAEVVELRRQQ